jgi:hypothetical protein
VAPPLSIVIGGRQSGKTESLIQWLLDAPEGEHRILVSHTSQEAMRLLRHCGNRGLPVESWQFVGVNEITRETWSAVTHHRGGQIVLGLDNMELMLSSFLPWPVGKITTTAEAELKVWNVNTR